MTAGVPIRKRRRLRARAVLPLVAALVPLHAEAQLKPETVQLFGRLFNSEEFEAKSFGPAKWLDGGEAYTTLEPADGNKAAVEIVRYETANLKRTVLVNAAQLTPSGGKKPLAVDDYAWSDDGSKLLIFTNAKPVWRQNTRGDYWVLDRKSGALEKLGGEALESSLLFAKFSPDGNRVGYVRGNNLFVEDLASRTITQLTKDGSATFINGTSDWVYEEELSLRDAWRWSPDGKSIAYWQFDTTGVANFPLLYNLAPPKEIVTGFPYPGLGHYPSRLDIPYPLAGTLNSAVRVGVISASGGETKWLAVPGDPRENYIVRMEWVPNSNQLVIEHLNRLQNTSEILLAEAAGAVKKVFEDRDSAWVDYLETFTWMKGGKEFLFLSERSGWRHAYAVNTETGALRELTRGSDVIAIEGVNEQDGWLYFLASPTNAAERYLYRARLSGEGQAERITPANAAGTHDYDVAPGGRWAFHTYSNVDTPPVVDLVQMAGQKTVRVLEDNATLRAKVAPLIAAAPAEFFQLDIGEGVTLDAWMMRPKNFDPAKRYPVLVYVYGEPAGQTVVNSYSSAADGFERAVAAEGYVVVSFDNRGTPAPKGRAWRKVIYGAIHPVIVHDQTAAIRALLKARPYLDASRVAVWGWSGGASSTLHLMFRSPEVYKVGMAVAPVPDLRMYDSIYEERYMGLPLENVEGYKASSAINFAEGLSGHLLLVHGSGDDNVHYAGSELLLNRLIELGKPVDFMEYPNRTHAIMEGKGTRYHLFSLLLRYLESNLPSGPR
jgi:dipeptidyl-peptidase 4